MDCRRRAVWLGVWVVVVLAGSGATTMAQEPARLGAFKLPEGAAAPTLDGKVTEDEWMKIEPYSSFTQTDPVEGAPASERTEVRVAYDRNNIYIGVICFDSDPTRIVVSQSRRDADLTETDAIILVFDTFNDTQNAFVFGTNPLGILYDGQVAAEGQTAGISSNQSGTGGSQRGTIGSFNANWDGDWQVKSSITERGWEAEMAIPFKTLRYPTGANRTWGFNLKRNIRRKNEQVYLSRVQRGSDIYRVSSAAKLGGLDLLRRFDLKVTPYVLGSVNKDYTVTSNQVDSRWNPFDGDRNVGLDVKWGVRPNLTADFTVNTDFAQVEADEEQVNLTRFDLFFPEKRPFFLENASMFQFGAPQMADLFFSRRIGLSGAGGTLQPIDIIGGARLSGKVGGSWNVGFLNIQTNDAEDFTGRPMAPDTNFSVARVQKEVGRSSYGAIFVGKYSTGTAGTAFSQWNRAYGVDANFQVSAGQRVSTFFARTDSPGATGSDHAGRVFYDFRNQLWQISGGFTQVGNRFNPEVGFLPRRGYRRPEFRGFFQPQPRNHRWIRRFAPHVSYTSYYGFDDKLQSSNTHVHPFEIQPMQGGRFGWFFDRVQDNPIAPFTVYNRDGNRVIIQPGDYTWYQHAFEYFHNPSSAVTGSIRYRIGNYYNGDFNSVEVTSDYRFTARITASLGWTRQDVNLPTGAFVANLIPLKATVSFTNLASLSALVQYNGQTGQYSSNIRLALLDRSGTGLFVVFNDRRDVLDSTSYDVVGRSFVVKYTRLFDF